MPWILCILVILIILNKTDFLNKKNHKNYYRQKNQANTTPQYTNQANYAGLYTKVSLLTKREQKQYQYLKEIADEKGLLICPKVRLLDLVTPMHGVKNYKALLSKVMSKHVDFVICTQEMVVVGIIELDDRTHLRQDRIERDAFVDTVLRSVGYKIIHTWEITPGILDSFLNETPQQEVEIKIVSPTGWIWNEDTKLWDPPENLK